MPAGRPPIWSDPEAFSDAVDAYFEQEKDSATWTGLALHLGFSSRDSLNDYKKLPEFSDSVKKALLRIECKYEKAMMKQPAGAIFALKNFGWIDKQVVDGASVVRILTVSDANNKYSVPADGGEFGSEGIPESVQ